MLLLRHRRLTADVEPVRGSLPWGLVARGLVRSTGQRRWVCYELVQGSPSPRWWAGASAYGVLESW